MSSALQVLSWVAALGNVILFVSQAPLMLSIVREGTSDKYSWLPSITLLNASSFWSGYTVWVLTDPVFWVANFPGMFFPAVFLLIFATYSSTPLRRAQILGATALSLAASWAFSVAVFSLLPRPQATVVSGAVCAASSFLFTRPR